MLKIAIIDASALARNLLTSVLESGGHEIVGESNLSSAGIAKLATLKPQLVCIDIGTMDSNGVEALALVKELMPKALVFVVSGSLDADLVKTAAEKGVHGFVVKPFNSVKVLASIRTAIFKLAKSNSTTTS